MKNFVLVLAASVLFASISTKAQNITNTLGNNGLFKVKYDTTEYFTIKQSDGTIVLPSQNADSQMGSVFKGSNRFLHTYYGDETIGYNTFLGINAGNFIMGGSFNYEGSKNTGVGTATLSSNTTGYGNSAFGVNTLFNNTTGFYNSAFGVNALFNNTTGSYNSAFGLGSLTSNTTGSRNSAFGVNALFDNTTGYYNSAFGYYSLFNNTTGYYNSAFGYYSLYFNTTGNYNSAFGLGSLTSNTTGSYNSAIGYNSLYSNTTGYYNSALGYGAGYIITDGGNLTCIGFDAQPSSGGASNEITLGNNFVSSLRCNVTSITSLSDARDKKNIRDLNLGINFLMNLKPRLFNWDRREWYEGNVCDGTKMQKTPTAGFIAQELDEVQKKEKAEWLNLVMKNNPERLEATPGNLLPIIVKAIQELKLEIDKLKKENDQLKTEVASLKSLSEEFTALRQLVVDMKLNQQANGKIFFVGDK